MNIPLVRKNYSAHELSEFFLALRKELSTHESAAMILSGLFELAFNSGGYAMAAEIHVPTELIGDMYKFPTFNVLLGHIDSTKILPNEEK